ncbi:MAG TPA: 16S rRNA (guanine(527)-N(7))-methyltransferase RsmG [Burkholderiales bacterium]|nr:16S rRNA (guanine(527)-N(7))-methyltransferase RsmG [Burkholderiales bacterium]
MKAVHGSRNESGGAILAAQVPDPLLRARLSAFLAELSKWNRAYNLTAIRDPKEIVTRHVLDSLSILPLVHGRVLDVGSGAGFPAVPLALANPELRVTALDSNGKKARFLRHVQRTLEIPNLEVVESRVESYRSDKMFDVITSRAFSALGEFIALTRHLLAPGGAWIAMKGKIDAQELAGIPDDVEIRENRRLSVPGLSEDRHAIIAVMK